MGKYKNIVLLSMMVLVLINSCVDTHLSYDTNKIEDEPTQTAESMIVEQIDPQNSDYGNYGDPSLYTPDKKYFMEKDFVADFENPGCMTMETFSNGNMIVCLNTPKYFVSHNGGYKDNGEVNFILTDENGKCLTEIYYNSIKYISPKYPQYLECQLNLQDWYIHQQHPDKYITDIIDIDTGKVIKRFLNLSFSYYGEDLAHLNISSHYYIDTDGNYYPADAPVITDWLSLKEEYYTIRKDGSDPGFYVPDDYYKQDYF